MKTKTGILVAAAIAGAIGLSACSSDSTDKTTAAPTTTSAEASATSSAASSAAVTSTKPNWHTDGPDVCIQLVKDLLDGDAKILSIDSSFYTDPAADGPDGEPMANMTPGDLVACTVDYQDPDNKEKLLSQTYSVATERFLDPVSKEVSAIGGGDFDLADYLVALSKIDGSNLQATMAAQDTKLGKAYSAYDWLYVNVSEPGMVSDENHFELTVKGLPEGEDTSTTGSLYVKLDGKTVINDALVA